MVNILVLLVLHLVTILVEFRLMVLNVRAEVKLAVRQVISAVRILVLQVILRGVHLHIEHTMVLVLLLGEGIGSLTHD